ncbi:MAG TPA: hydrogenase, partial [Methylomirabilota bacterium]|nr:hydrogenase [Methylomirabilota bacterium]
MAETAPTLNIQPPPPELERQPLVRNRRSPGWISDKVAGIVEGKTPKWWWAAFIPSFLVMCLCFT